MTIEETFKHQLHTYYIEMLMDLKAEKRRPESYRYKDRFDIYIKCLSDAYTSLFGENSANEITDYGTELKTALIYETDFMIKQYDLKCARESLENITWYKGLQELLPVLSNDDLLSLYHKSDRAHSTYIDDVEYFHGAIEEMQKKYNVYPAEK